LTCPVRLQRAAGDPHIHTQTHAHTRTHGGQYYGRAHESRRFLLQGVHLTRRTYDRITGFSPVQLDGCRRMAALRRTALLDSWRMFSCCCALVFRLNSLVVVFLTTH
ncbi:unnamed protein product, partial [Laminaria digitata]